MAHDVFISYKREDLDLCTEVFKLIQRIGYIPYRDVDDLTGGQPWHDQLQKALSQPDLKPSVVVLCTKAAVEKPEGMLDEIRQARENDLAIIPIELDPGAMKSLFGAAGYEKPGRMQYIDAVDPSGRHVVDDRMEDALRRSLTRKVRLWLDGCRGLAKEWSERLSPAVSFWETTWRDYFSFDGPDGLPGSVSLTARGGSGKSFLIARCVRHLLDDPEVYPVLIEEAMLREPGELSRRLGARSVDELPQQMEALSARRPGEHLGWKPMRAVFVVDGLDQMVTPGDVQQKQLVDGLNVLVNSAPVLIGCRGEVWDAWYAGRVSVREIQVPELDQRQVRNLLRPTPLADQFNPLLQVPFFLDIALQKSNTWPALPSTETEFLHQIWSDAVDEGSPGLSGDAGRAWIVENLAACQLAQLDYDVPLAELRGQTGFLPEYLTGLRELKAAGLLVEQPRGTGPTVRLRHDLLDNYSMVNVLLSGEKQKSCRDLCRRCDKDCGWSLLATLVQAAQDWDDGELKRELFSEFLFLLDHKKFGDPAMARAWAVTHVLRNCFHPLFDLMLEALAGEPVPSLDFKDPAQAETRASSLEPPRLTQEAASTLASAFMALQSGSTEDAARAVPVLAAGLQRWPLKARFLDALSKYRTADALAAILSFARRQLEERDDVGSLFYVARNLRHFPQPEGAALLREIFADTTLKPMVRRLAAEGLNSLQPGRVEAPLRDEDEIVEGLKPREGDGKRYTDWHVVQDYAIDVRRRLARGERFSPRVLEALVLALRHDQTFARRSVAQALALLEEPAARDALLNEVLEPALPAEVRTACLEALERQLKSLAEPKGRQAFRYLLLRAAGAARHAGAAATERGLSELALNPALRTPADWLLTGQAAEVAPPAGDPWSARCSLAEVEIEPATLRELAELEPEDVGPNRESKYRLASLDAAGGSLSITLAPTTWQLGKGFHNAVRKHPDRFLRDGRRWLEPVPLGDARLPGLAVVHVVVLTADGLVLAARRSKKLAYAPLHWSISFEEQVTAQDVQEGDRTFHHAALRGMTEEFGIAVDPARSHLLSALLEMDNLNLAAVVLIEAAQTLDEIRRSWSGDPPPSHAWEAQALAGIETNAVMAVAGGAESRLEPLHPTSRLRCAMLARWLRR
jgi:hypothetical protein